MKPTRFELSKWYMDCVTPGGDALVAYSADLRWRTLTVAYEGALEMRAGRAPSSSSSLKPHRTPLVDGSRIAWQSRSLGIDATWSPAHPTPAIYETIYQSFSGSIDWSCLLPSAAAHVTTRGGALNGRGYVEHLRMTVAPWRLPISSLRWGRIADEEEAIVWIQWLGDFQATIVYASGTRVAPVHVDDERVTLADGTTIEFDRRSVLRNGALGTTVVSSVPVLRELTPLRILSTRECKWLSRAVVTRRGRPARETWAIHELVTWPETAQGSRRTAHGLST